MSDWSAQQYLKFEDDRTRAARDLLAQVPLQRIRLAVDLGCGPGNSTELLATRYPEARVIGVDSSPDMLRQARERLPHCEFIEADVTAWAPADPPDLFFANLIRELAGDEGARDHLPPPEAYYDLLKSLCRRVDIWHTIYNHSLAGPAAIVEWFRGSALRPFLAALDLAAAKSFSKPTKKKSPATTKPGPTDKSSSDSQDYLS